jgi:hypothetical protein
MSMERVRRLATVALTAAVAVAGLAGCRSAPSVAAYVGQNQISEDRVSAVYEEARDNAATAAAISRVPRRSNGRMWSTRWSAWT